MADTEQIIEISGEDGDVIKLTVIEETKLNGTKYVLALDDFEDEEQEAVILKLVKDENSDNIYEFVEDDKELKAVAGLFEELLEDTELVTE